MHRQGLGKVLAEETDEIDKDDKIKRKTRRKRADLQPEAGREAALIGGI